MRYALGGGREWGSEPVLEAGDPGGTDAFVSSVGSGPKLRAILPHGHPQFAQVGATSLCEILSFPCCARDHGKGRKEKMGEEAGWGGAFGVCREQRL